MVRALIESMNIKDISVNRGVAITGQMGFSSSAELAGTACVVAFVLGKKWDGALYLYQHRFAALDGEHYLRGCLLQTTMPGIGETKSVELPTRALGAYDWDALAILAPGGAIRVWTDGGRAVGLHWSDISAAINVAYDTMWFTDALKINQLQTGLCAVERPATPTELDVTAALRSAGSSEIRSARATLSASPSGVITVLSGISPQVPSSAGGVGVSLQGIVGDEVMHDNIVPWQYSKAVPVEIAVAQLMEVGAAALYAPCSAVWYQNPVTGAWTGYPDPHEIPEELASLYVLVPLQQYNVLMRSPTTWIQGPGKLEGGVVVPTTSGQIPSKTYQTAFWVVKRNTVDAFTLKVTSEGIVTDTGEAITASKEIAVPALTTVAEVLSLSIVKG